MGKNKFKNIKAIFFDVGDTLYTNEAMEKAYPKELYKLIAKVKSIEKDAAKLLLKANPEPEDMKFADTSISSIQELTSFI